MFIKVSLDHEGFKSKPSNQVAKISSRIAKEIAEISAGELAHMVGADGHTFCPAVFSDGKRRQDHFKEMQLFGLDFDSGVSYEVIAKRCRELELPILFSYHTFSSSNEHPRFRVIFCHVCKTANFEAAKLILDFLIAVFPEADSNCRDLTRMFFGGKGIIECNETAVFDVSKFFRNAQEYIYRSNPHNYGRQIGKIAGQYHLAMNKGWLDICTAKVGEETELNAEENKGKTIGIIYDLTQISSRLIIFKEGDSSTFHQTSRCGQHIPLLEKISVDKIAERCQLCGMFFKGRDIGHDLRFMIATNLQYVKGMKGVFLEAIRRSNCDLDKWAATWKYNRDNQYKPMDCRSTCPFFYTCTHERNIIATLRNDRRIIKCEEEQFVLLEESREQMKTHLENAIRSGGTDIHLITAQTGLGKTHAYVELLGSFKQKVVIAVPTVKLKNEVTKKIRFRWGDDVAYEAVSLEDLKLDIEQRSEIASLYDQGCYKEARAVIREIEKKLPESWQKDQLKKYLDFRQILSECSRHVVMTHEQLLNMSGSVLSGYTIIVDEDILYTMLRRTASVSVTDIMKSLDAGLFAGAKAQELRRVIDLSDNAYLKGYPMDNHLYIKKTKQEENEIYANINDLFKAGAYHRNGDLIEYFIARKLPEQKIIVLSATLDMEIYKAYFSERKVMFHETSKARYQGKLIQYTRYSMSRRCIKQLTDQEGGETALLLKLKKVANGAEYGIGFKALDGTLNKIMPVNNGCRHLGNVAGTDDFNGKNGMIIGTYHLNESSYKLIACFLSGIVLGSDSVQHTLRVRYRGWEFPFMSYSDPLLQRIQLYLISSEAEQAIGRSRLLNNDATVYLFSNLPCKQAIIESKDYLEKL